MQIKTKAGRMIDMPSPEEDAVITAAAESDPDARPLTDAEWAAIRPRRGRQTSAREITVTIRLDADVVAAFKSHAARQGTRYQSVINDVLRKHAEDL